jgi:CYTH domain-containing protein
MKEIERKWLLDSELAKEMVSNSNLKVSEISQYYLDKDTRIRLESHNFEEEPVLTIKRGKGRIRDEVNINIKNAEAHQLVKLAKCSLTKKRYYINIGPFEMFIDKFNDNLFICEVEFKNVEECNNFDPHKYLNSQLFVKEVTDEEEFTNYDLAKRKINVVETEQEERERFYRGE